MAKKSGKTAAPPRPWRDILFDRNQPVASLTVGGERCEIVPNTLPAIGTRHYARTLPCGLTVILSRVTFSDYGGVSFVVRLRNDGKTDSPRLSAQFGLDVTLPVTDAARFETLEGDSCDGNSFLPVTVPLAEGTAVDRQPFGGRASSVSAFPYFDLADEGQSLTVGIGWSGQWRVSVTRSDDAVRLTAGIADADFYLRPGETARMPRILLVVNALSLDDNRRVFRRLMRARFSPAEQLGDDLRQPLSVQNFDRYFESEPAWRCETMQRKQIADAAAIGHIDTYWFDAAWFREAFPNGVGNYSFHDGLPNGLRGMSDLARSLGMRYMLWFEPGRVYQGSEVDVDHPDFLLRLRDPARQENRLFNYGDPAAADWMAQNIGDFIEREGVDIYREDFNIDPLDYWREHDEPGRAGLTEIRYIEGKYRVWDTLHSRFPQLLIDNCSSGGRLLDIEMSSRAVPCWRSDTGCFPPSEERPTTLWHQNQTLGLWRYLPFFSTSIWEPNAYCARTNGTSGAAFSVPFESDGYDRALYSRVAEEVDRLRDYWRGDFYPHADASLATDRWCCWQLHLPDEGRGMAVAFRRADADADAFAIPFAALNPGATYSVTVTDEQYTAAQPLYLTGAELARFVVEADRGESVLVEYRRHG